MKKLLLIGLIGVLFFNYSCKEHMGYDKNIKIITSTYYPIYWAFGEIVTDTNKLNPEGYRRILNLNDGKIKSQSNFWYERGKFELSSKSIYKDEKIYRYNEYGDLDTVINNNPDNPDNNIKRYNRNHYLVTGDGFSSEIFLNNGNIIKTHHINNDQEIIINHNILKIDDFNNVLIHTENTSSRFKIKYEEPMDSLAFSNNWRSRYGNYEDYVLEINERNKKVGEWGEFHNDSTLVITSYEYLNK